MRPSRMVQSVELLLDEAGEQQVLAQWRALVEAGLPSQGRHRSPSNRPHVTLVAVPAVDAAGEEQVAVACRGALPLTATLGAPALFGHGGDTVVLVRLVVVTTALLVLHDRVATATDVPVDDLTSPGRWTPHVTLASRLPLDDVPAALRAVGGSTGKAVRLDQVRRWDSDRRLTWSPLSGPPDRP